MRAATSTWQDKHGRPGSDYSKIRLLKGMMGFASVSASQPDEEVTVPAGTLATVLGVNGEERLLTVEFSGVEGNVFGNPSWDEVEIVRFHFAQADDAQD